MLQSVRISRRQSEIREALAGLVGKDNLTDDETRSMDTMDAEYRSNESKYRAALIVEDTERREAGDALGDKSEKDFAALTDRFECRQIVEFYNEGRELSGATAEVVQELRSHGSYRGIPLPWQALEQRAGETVASGVPSPVRTAGIIDRIFADSVSGKMGVSFLNIDSGSNAYPIVSSSVAASWQTSETGSVGSPQAFTTAERSVSPDHTLGVQMKITRKALKQSGDGLESAVRRDLQACIGVELDRVIWLGSGASGQPNGLLKASSPATQTVYGSTITDINAAASWSAFRAAVVRFMTANAANGPGSVKLLIRPEVYDTMEGSFWKIDSNVSDAFTEWDRLVKNIPAGNIAISSNALAAPTGSPLESKAVLTCTVGGLAPAYFATYGAVDVIRDVYSDAASGGLRLTGLVTCDLTGTRAQQIEVLDGIQ